VGQINSSAESIILMVQDFFDIIYIINYIYLFPFTNSMMIKTGA
jgi:hypothetical protein